MQRRWWSLSGGRGAAAGGGETAPAEGVQTCRGPAAGAVARRLRKDFPHDAEMRVSHETIYQTLFVQARGELRTQLRLALRGGRSQRRPRRSGRPKQARICGMVSILQRPAEAADRAVPGHWKAI